MLGPLSTLWFDFFLSPASGTCDFEGGLCGYTHDTNAEFEWTNNTGPTYSRNTGPIGDHSTGTGHVPVYTVG